MAEIEHMLQSAHANLAHTVRDNPTSEAVAAFWEIHRLVAQVNASKQTMEAYNG